MPLAIFISFSKLLLLINSILKWKLQISLKDLNIMFFFFISTLSFLLLLLPKPLLPSWVGEMRLLAALLCQESLYDSFHWLKNYRLFATEIFRHTRAMFVKENEAEEEAAAAETFTILDLPELALESVLEKLPPLSMCNMARVCASLRDRCRSDHLWEGHMEEKWGKVVGKSAEKEWVKYVESRKNRISGTRTRTRWIDRFLNCEPSPMRNDFFGSVMARYVALESGMFWFPAQVYNRENGHVGFVLSCYDAELSYDSRTDTFRARYPPHGQRLAVVEEGVEWARIRAAPVDTPAHELHVSDCLADLRPSDHIEIQWRRNKEFPYGWWYGVVGHLDSCDGDEYRCRCFSSDTVVLEFKQYTAESRWRRASVNRKDHEEEGSETDGFYGGIRKLYSKDEISMWRQLWPTETLE